MINRLSFKISKWCIEILNITEEERQVIHYGAEIILDAIVKLFFLTLIGILLGKPLEFLIALLSFCSLRYWAGGKHCRTSFRCLCFMIAMCIIATYVPGYLVLLPNIILLYGMLILGILVLVYAPAQTGKSIQLNSDAKKKKRIGSCIWIFIEFAAIVAIKSRYWKWLIFIAVLIEILSIVSIGETKAKEE